MRFEFATASRIIFGVGARRQLPGLLREFGTRALVITGASADRAAPLIATLEASGIRCSLFSIPREPTLDLVREGALTGRHAEIIAGIGGGSVMDAAKAIAALAVNSGEPLDYLEVIGRGQPLRNTPLPWVAVPTTAGTGAEVTRNAVLDSPEHGVKASLRSPLLFAKVALIDPELTFDVPPQITAATGLDTLTQLIEPYVSTRTNPLTDLFCVEGMKRVAWSLRAAFRDGHNRDARESMAYASLLSGLSLTNAGLGVVHGFAAPLGGMLHAPHGALCAAVLPAGVAINIRTLRKRDPNHEALRRYRKIAGILTGNPQAEAENAIGWIADLLSQLSIAPLRAYRLQQKQIPELVEKAARANSMKTNPIVLTTDELTEVAERSL